jgi:hypothetical protein
MSEWDERGKDMIKGFLLALSPPLPILTPLKAKFFSID